MLLDYDIPAVEKTPQNIETANDMQNVIMATQAVQPQAANMPVPTTTQTGGQSLQGE